MLAGLVSLAALSSLLPSALAAETRLICPGARHTAIDLRCCPWYDIRDDLISDIFQGTCGEDAHSTLRIAFHDAIGFSQNSNKGGGADGSIIAFPQELGFSANAGIDEIVGDLQPFADAHHISYGDVIQFGSSVAISLCPGAPLVRTFIGRPNATAAAPDGTVPEPFNPVTDILARMADAGFSSDELIALLASHSIAAQDEIEPAIERSPFDSTPAIMDTQVFLEVLLKGTAFPGDGAHQGEVQSPLAGEFRLQSDAALARDSRTACTWQGFVNNQNLMRARFSAAMTKLSLLGQAGNRLIECTEAIPLAGNVNKATTFPAGKTRADIEQSCATSAFPTLSTDPGPATTVARVPAQ